MAPSMPSMLVWPSEEIPGELVSNFYVGRRRLFFLWLKKSLKKYTKTATTTYNNSTISKVPTSSYRWYQYHQLGAWSETQSQTTETGVQASEAEVAAKKFATFFFTLLLRMSTLRVSP